MYTVTSLVTLPKLQLADWLPPEPDDETQDPLPQRTEKVPGTPDMVKVTGTVVSPPVAESVPPPRISGRSDSRHPTSPHPGTESSWPAPPDRRAENPEDIGSLIPGDHSATFTLITAAFRAEAFWAWVVGVAGDVVAEGRVVCVGRFAVVAVATVVDVVDVDDVGEVATVVVVTGTPPIVRSDAGGKPGFTSGACNTSGSASATVCPLITPLSTSDVSVPSTETTRLAISVGPDCVTTS
jgi:hypothetical protein